MSLHFGRKRQDQIPRDQPLPSGQCQLCTFFRFLISICPQAKASHSDHEPADGKCMLESGLQDCAGLGRGVRMISFSASFSKYIYFFGVGILNFIKYFLNFDL